MNTVIFTGPTLSAEETGREIEARCLPPAQYGDVYRAVTLFQPDTIAIIDGYFNQVPAVWHKEILWALDQGIRVAGGASMGALRAAELAAFGMEGVGAIYAAYRDGRFPPYTDDFDNDDEVAVIHGPSELGFPAASEALVNIRATLAAAARANIISESIRDLLVDRAKGYFYAERNFDNLLKEGDEPATSEELSELAAWLPENRVDQKRTDALLLLRRLADARERAAPEFRFEHTTLWQNAVQEMNQLPTPTSPILDELRLLGEDFFALQNLVLEESLGDREDESDIASLTESDLGSIGAWHHKPLQDREVAQFHSDAPPYWLVRKMLSRLQTSGDLEALKARSQDKHKKLAGRSLPRATDLSDLELLQLMDWYFSERLKAEIPHDTDLYAGQLGYQHPDEFHELVLREYLYQQFET